MSSASRRTPLEGLCAWFSVAMPIAVTFWHLASDANWRADLATVRGLGALPALGDGCLSSWLVQLTILLPFGGRELRAALVSALALAVASRLVYALSRDLLEANALTPRLSPLLALCATWLATLSPTWQLEGTIAGGASVAAALVLALVVIRTRLPATDARSWAVAGIVAALIGLENLPAGIVACAVLGADIFFGKQIPSGRVILIAVAALAVTTGVFALPVLVRPAAERMMLDLGSSAAALPLTSTTVEASALARWLDDIGVLSTLTAAFGVVVLLLSAALRRYAVPWIILVAANLCFPSPPTERLFADPLAVLSPLALSGIAICASIGVQTIALTLVRLRLPLAQPAGALLVTLFFSLALVTAEDGGRLVVQQRAHAAQIWTDEALASLPSGALLLVHSPEIVWRLWASRAISDERPDLVVVPLALLDEAAVAIDAIEREPALAPLVRDMAVTGRAGEFSLSTLADVRPLYVQLGPHWNQRLLDHLIPHPLWFEFAPHALGRSDRKEALRQGRATFARVLKSANVPNKRDDLTLSVLAACAREHATVLAALGDREMLQWVLEDLESIDPQQPFLLEMRRRLEQDQRGAIDIAGLLEPLAAAQGTTSG